MIMKTSEKLDNLINRLLSSEMSMEVFQAHYEKLYIGPTGNELTPAQELYYGQICDKLEFTYSEPIPKEDSQYGYLSYDQFREFLKGYLSHRPN